MSQRTEDHSLWRDFDEMLVALDTDLTTNTGVHDGSPLIKALAPFSELVGPAALVGFYHRADGAVRVIRSASFLLQHGSSRTLEPIESDASLPREALPIDVADLFLPAEGAYVDIELEHVYCRFIPGTLDGDAQKRLAALANLYQRYFLDSRNLENFIDGSVYSYARPAPGELHPKFETFGAIASAIRAEFGLNASFLVFTGPREPDYQPTPKDFPTSDNRPLEAILSFSSDPQFLRKLGLAVQFKQSIIGSTDLGDHYSIHPAWDNTVRQSRVDGLLVVWSPEPISLMCYRAAATWLREFSVRRHLERVRFLNELRHAVEEQIRGNAAGRLWGRQARMRAISTLAQWVCEQLCSLTNAESASFRMHELDRDVARQYARYQTALGTYATSLASSKMAPDIPLSKWRRSAVAFAFKTDDTAPIVHIGNMMQLPDPLVKQGLQAVIRTRPDSKSEAIIRIRQGGLLAAVINLESPIEDALETDIEFLTGCGEVMSDLLTRLDTFGDRTALAEMASNHIAFHAVKGFVKQWEAGDTSAAEFIAARLKSHMFGRDLVSAGNQFEFGEKILDIGAPNARTVLISTFHEWIGKALSRVQSDKSPRDVLRGNIPLDFPLGGLPSLAVIFDSIWTNVVKYRLVDQNSIKLSTSKDTPFGTRSFLVEWSAPNKLDERVDRDLLFLRPPASKTDRHYGFMLLGVHVRLLGGRLALIENSETPGFVLRLALPCQQVRSK